MGKQQDEVRKQDFIASQESQPIAETAGTTKEIAESQGVDAEKRHNLQVYEQYQKQETRQRNLGNIVGADQLAKLKDEAKEKAGLNEKKEK